MKIDLNLIGGNGARLVGNWQGNFKECILTAGVDNAVVDGEVRGLQGRIEAPEGATVYTISGVRTGTENLAPGIYIVSFNGKTSKVAVR